MNFYTVINSQNNKILGNKVALADTFLSRMVGLLGKNGLAPNEGLIITSCKSIHMVFMRFPIDVIFIDKTNKVVGLVENIKPFYFSRMFMKADRAIELPAGNILHNNVQLEGILQIQPNQ